MRVSRLGHEEGSKSHVEAGAVRVERVAGLDHEADKSLGAPELFELGHEAWQRGFRGTGGEHQKNLLAKKPEKAQDAEASHTSDDSEDDDNEKNGGDVQGGHQFEKRTERSKAVFANGKSHGAKRPDGSEAHQDADNAEDNASQ